MRDNAPGQPSARALRTRSMSMVRASATLAGMRMAVSRNRSKSMRTARGGRLCGASSWGARTCCRPAARPPPRPRPHRVERLGCRPRWTGAAPPDVPGIRQRPATGSSRVMRSFNNRSSKACGSPRAATTCTGHERILRSTSAFRVSPEWAAARRGGRSSVRSHLRAGNHEQAVPLSEQARRGRLHDSGIPRICHIAVMRACPEASARCGRYPAPRSEGPV